MRRSPLHPGRIAAILGLVAVAACADGGPADPAEAPTAGAEFLPGDLFVPAPDARLTAAQEGYVKALVSRPGFGDARIVRLAETARTQLTDGREVTLGLGEGTAPLVARGRRTEANGSARVWSGPVNGLQGWADLVLTERGVTAAIRSGRETLAVVPLGGGLHAVAPVDARRLPRDHDEAFLRADAAAPGAGTVRSAVPEAAGPSYQSSGAAAPRVDVLVVWTQGVAASYYDPAGLATLAISQANQAHTNSDVYAEMYLAGTSQVTYSEAGRTYAQHVNSLIATADGVLDNVPPLRNSTLADVVVMLVNDDNDNLCGRVADNGIGATATNAYAVVNWTCVVGNNYTFHHEIGHLHGARHQTSADGTNTPYAYGHGFVSPTNAFRTIMAIDTCSGCPRVNYWSNPNVTYTNGQAMGNATSADVAQVMEVRAPTVRNFRVLPNPQNLVHANAGVANALPSFSWSAVTNAHNYIVERCIVNNGASYADWCFFPVATPLATTWSEPYSTTQTGSTSGSFNCPRVAMYRVRADGRAGISAYSQINICVY